MHRSLKTHAEGGQDGNKKQEDEVPGSGIRQALMQDDATAIRLISEGTDEVAGIFLGTYGITLPTEVDIVDLIEFGIEQSINLCAGDFAQEITATIDFVSQNLEANGISY